VREKSSDVTVVMVEGTLSRSIRPGAEGAGAAGAGVAGRAADDLAFGAAWRGRAGAVTGVGATTRTSGSGVASDGGVAGGSCASAVPATSAARLTDPSKASRLAQPDRQAPTGPNRGTIRPGALLCIGVPDPVPKHIGPKQPGYSCYSNEVGGF